MNDHCISVLLYISNKLAGDWDECERRYRKLPETERVLHDVNDFHFELVRGGLGIFFTNGPGRHWRETLRALEQVGAPRSYAALKQACAFFPGGSPPDDRALFEEQALDKDFQRKVGELELDEGETWLAMQDFCSRHFPEPLPGHPSPYPKPPTRRERMQRKVREHTALLRGRKFAPTSFYELLRQKGIDWNRAAMINSYFDHGCWMATLIDDKPRFVDFEIEFSSGTKSTGPVGEIRNITRWDEQALSGAWWKRFSRRAKGPDPTDPITIALELLASEVG
jgi:hypothetical protein